MAGRSGVRSRRTRVYDCNYNMGESYYKPALDRLDRKTSGRPEPDSAPTMAAARDIEDRYGRTFADDDLNGARRRAEKVIAEESLFDSRGGRASRGRPLSAAMEDVENEFGEEVSSSLRRLRANKKKSMFLDDVDMESTVANLQSRSRIGLAEKIMESAGLGSTSETVEITTRRRAPRVTTIDESSSTTKWTAIDEGAASRAKASRARLADLESETAAIQQRQQVRERRAADLRAFLNSAENDEF